MDLHAWITQQVDKVEASALAELKYRRATFEPHGGGPALTGTVTDVRHGPDGITFDIAQLGVEPRDEVPAPMQAAAAVLRRCEADRRILARHRKWAQSSYCEACDQDLTTNLNDCPELLDLGHAHGLTDEILAGLDRPQPPERKPARPDGPSLLGSATNMWRDALVAHLTLPITTSDVPEALRGPGWKP